MFTIEVQDVLAIGEASLATGLEEEVDAVITGKSVNHQTDTGDDIDYEHCVQKYVAYHDKTFCIIECLVKI